MAEDTLRSPGDAQGTNGLPLSSPLKKAALLLLVIIVLGTLWPNIRNSAGEGNLYAHLAQAFLDGRLDIRERLHDVAIHHGRYYVPFPPFPALVLLPFVALGGVVNTRPVMISLALSVLNALVLSRTLNRLGSSSRITPWIVAAFLLGTGYWLCVTVSASVWFFAHVVSVTCLFLAIGECFGKGRGPLVGLFLGAAALSRQSTVFALPFLAMALWKNQHHADRKSRVLNQAWFLTCSGLCLGVFLIYNWSRFGDMFDTGYSYIRFSGFQGERMARYGLFHPIYVPFNLINLFLQGFHIQFSPPTYLWPGRIWMDPFGTSLTFASPFVFLSLLAEWRAPLKQAAWLSIGSTLIFSLFFCNNGWVQWNAHRFTLDFLPILILLVASGAQRVREIWWKAAIVYSIGLNILAIFGIPLLNKIGR